MLGQKIKDLRKQKHISQTELGKFVGVSQTTVTAWENGRAEPSSPFLAKLADFFNVTTDQLLGRPEKNDNNNTADLANKDTIFTYEGKPIPPEDLKYIKRILLGDRK